MQQACKYTSKQKLKHIIISPNEAITALGWKDGQELNYEKWAIGCWGEKRLRREKQS